MEIHKKDIADHLLRKDMYSLSIERNISLIIKNNFTKHIIEGHTI